MVPGVVKDGLEAQQRGVKLPLTVQSGDVETQLEPPRRQNPKRGKQSDMTRA